MAVFVAPVGVELARHVLDLAFHSFSLLCLPNYPRFVLLSLDRLQRERVVGEGLLDAEIHSVRDNLLAAQLGLVYSLAHVAPLGVVSEFQCIQSRLTVAVLYGLNPTLLSVGEPFVYELIQLECSEIFQSVSRWQSRRPRSLGPIDRG